MQSMTIQTDRSIKRADTLFALESVFAEYHPELLEEYGVFAKEGKDEEKIGRRLWFYGAKNMEHQIHRIQLLTDNEGESFYDQAIRSMGGESFQVIEVAETTIQEENEKNEKELEKMLEEEKQELPTESNPIEAVNQLKKSSLLSLVLPNPEEISNQCITLEELPSHRELEKGTEEFVSYKTEGLERKLLFTSYLAENFSDYTNTEKKGSLFYENEYLLVGKENDQENLEAVAEKILFVRMALNYGYLLTDSAKQAEVEAMATTLATALNSPPMIVLIKQAILFSWAYGESILDLRTLYKGEEVPVVKTSENWQMQLGNLVKLGTADEVKEEKASGEGMCYGDYIKAFLQLEEKEVLSMRALDLIETKVGVRVDECVTALEIRSTLETQVGIKDTFLTEFYYQ